MSRILTRKAFIFWLEQKESDECVGDLYMSPIYFWLLETTPGIFAISVDEKISFRSIRYGYFSERTPNWILYFLSKVGRRKVTAEESLRILKKIPPNIWKYRPEQVKALHVL